jgi:hypothetical protein
MSATLSPARKTAGFFPNSGFGFIALFLIAIIGFWKPYFALKFGDIDRYTHIHAVTMVVWCLLLIGQALLVRFGNRALHKKIGVAAYVLGPVIMASIFLLSHNRIMKHRAEITVEHSNLLFVQLGTLVIFSFAYLLAMYKKNDPAIHARAMIGTSLTMIDPSLARWFIFYLPPIPHAELINYAATLGVLVALMVFERKARRGRWVFPVMTGIFIVYFAGTLTVANSEWWRRFAIWFAGLPIT